MDTAREHRLWGDIRAGNMTALSAMATGHMGIVHYLAQRYVNDGDPPDVLEELVGEGMLALAESERAFAADELGCKFSTYCFVRVNRAMVSWRRTNHLRMPSEWRARTEKQARKTREEVAALFGRLGLDGDPTPEQMAWLNGDMSDGAVRRQRALSEGAGVAVDIASLEETEPALWVAPDEGAAPEGRLPSAPRELLDTVNGSATLERHATHHRFDAIGEALGVTGKEVEQHFLQARRAYGYGTP